MDYTNEICQGCGKKFSDSDDIVVCPECGTPQHRECYKKENKCVNEHLHSDAYEWTPRHQTASPVQNEKTGRVCSFCGHENPDDAPACENCGQPFEFFGRPIFDERGNENTGGHNIPDDSCSYKPPFDVGEYKPSDSKYRPYDGIISDTSKEDTEEDESNFENSSRVYGAHFTEGSTCGVSNRDLEVYLRANIETYKRKFTSIERKKPTFNFGAFIFGYIWYFFRKMKKQGIIFMTLAICLTIGFYNPIKEASEALSSKTAVIQQMLTEAQNGTLTEAQEDEILDEMQEILDEYLPVSMAYLGCNIALNLVAALLADRFYKKKCIGDIKLINKVHAGEDDMRIAAFMQRGGTSFLFAVCAYILQSSIISLVSGVFFQ